MAEAPGSALIRSDLSHPRQSLHHGLRVMRGWREILKKRMLRGSHRFLAEFKRMLRGSRIIPVARFLDFEKLVRAQIFWLFALHFDVRLSRSRVML